MIAADEQLLPADPAWKERYPYAGFLFLDDPAPLDPALDASLAEGEPPVYIGFGSMAGGPPERAAGILHEVASATGRRLLVASGAAKLFADGAMPEGILVVREAPHAKLFPRAAVVVHHGGSGMTASALRAGVPQVVLPMRLDQFHHAHHLRRAGLAPKALKLSKNDAKALTLAIEQALALPAEPRREMAERLRERDAGAAIVEKLERMVAGG